jgi:pentatricopeptide repeat protein
MRVNAQRGRIDDAFRLFDEMLEGGGTAEVAHIAALLLACDRRSDAARAMGVLSRMPSLKLRPTTLTYNMALATCAKRGELALVDQLLAEMDAGPEESKPDIVTLNTALDAYKRADEWEACLEFLLKMESERQTVPDVVSVNTAIKACKDNAQFELAMQLFDGMGARGLVPDSVSYAEVIAACGKAGDWERAQAIFAEAFNSPLGVNLFIWNAVVGAAVACEQSETALAYIKQMRDAGFNPDIVTFTTVMTMCSKKEVRDPRRWP